MNCDRISKPIRHALFFFCLLFPFYLTAASAFAGKTRDLIVVIDVSASMEDVFDKAKAEAKQFVSSSQIGDRVTLITFGKSSHLLERARINSSHTIGRILSEIDELEATELNTNLPSAMQRGLKEMEQFYDEDPDAERVLMWLSDDKNNPPDDLPNLITFSTLKEQETAKLPDHNWFVFESPIKSRVESQRQWFVDWARRNKVSLRAMSLSKSLGTLMIPQSEKEFSVSFEPDSAGVWGTSFEVAAEVEDKEQGDYSASVPINPKVIVCDSGPWKQTFKISLPERPGDYTCKVSFVLPSDKLLEINPPQLILEGRVRAESKPFDMQRAILERAMYEKSRASIKQEFAKQIVEDAKEAIWRGTLVFGPVVSGGAYRASAPLTLTKDIPPESIYMQTTFKLPEGFELEPVFRREKGQLVADVLLTVASYVEPEAGWEVKGVLSFLSTDEAVKISPSKIPIRMYSQTQRSRWGRRELTLGAYEQIASTAGVAGYYAIRMGEAVLALVALWLISRVAKKYLFASTNLIGMLEIARNPAGQRMKLRYFNLQRMGRYKRRNWLTIGSSKKADIVLAHPSVADVHAKIMTTKIDTSVMIFVQPLSGAKVMVNDAIFSRQKEISDQDRVAIGEFVFLYKRPEVYRETIVSFANGNSLRGTLISWDIDAPKFEFLPMGAPSLSAKMVIEFSELKTVSFVRKPRRFSLDRFAANGKTTGYPVEIFFKDGELLEGNMMSDNGEWNKRFYLIPKGREDVALMLVERSAVQDVFKGEPSKQPFFRIRHALRVLTGRTS